MRLSNSFGKTLRNAPTDAEMISHQLLIRANFVRPLGAGIYTYMPLGYRVLRKLSAIVSEEMEAVGGQEMLMPNMHPAAIWQATGRWEEMEPIMMRITKSGKSGTASREYAMSPTHEEVVVDLASREIESYRDMPQVIFHISKKFRDEPRPRGGMIRLREFIMKDAYSIHISEDSLDEFYPSMVQAYINTFTRCELPVVQVNADVGAMGGKASHEFLFQHAQGEDTFIQSESGKYAANVEAAIFTREGEKPAELEPLAKVVTPDCKTIADVAAFLDVPTSQTLKAVFFWGTPVGKPESDGRFIFAVVRGDLDVNETKLANALGGITLRAATEEEIVATGAVPGYASPVGLNIAKDADSDGVYVIADISINNGGNYVVGANDTGYHYTGTNYPRDHQITQIADIAQADTGHLCAVSNDGSRLVARRAIEVGHCFKLGTRYSQPTNTTALGKDGRPHVLYMGSYGIGMDRLMGVIVEAHHDENGIVWPRSIAPYDVHLMTVGKGDEPIQVADQLYADLKAAGLSVLYDDRSISPGVKFKDADLMGMPIRVSVGKRSLKNGGAEIKLRNEEERTIVAIEDVITHIKAL